MALVVEDGTGLANAEAYADADAAKAYWDARGFDYSAYGDAEIEQALRRAATYLDVHYRSRWTGRPTTGRVQALAWPRHRAFDPYGRLPSDQIPREVIMASIEAAAREAASPGSLSPDIEGQRTVEESISGAVTIRYDNAGDQRPVLTIVEELIGGLLCSSFAAIINRA